MKSVVLKSLWPWAIWALGTSFVLFQFVMQLSSGIFVESLMRSFPMTSFTAGVLSGSYYYIYLILQTPAGMLIDRYGVRKLLGTGGLVCALGCYLFATAHAYYVAEIGRILMGGGSAFAFVGTLYLISQWFPTSRFAFMMGISDMFASLGTLSFNVVIAHMIAEESWRDVMLVASGIAASIGILIWLVVRDHSPEIKVEKHLHVKPQGLKVILKDYRFWINGIYVGILFSILGVFSGLWGVPFIALQNNISITQATFIASSIFIGLAVACPTIGWFYTKLRRQLHLVLFFATGMAGLLLTLLIYYPPKSLVVYTAIMISLGVLSCVYLFNFSYAKEISPYNTETTTMGFTNTLCVGMVPILQALTGWLMHMSHHFKGVGELNSISDYHVALAALPISLFIASIMGLFLKHKE